MTIAVERLAELLGRLRLRPPACETPSCAFLRTLRVSYFARIFRLRSCEHRDQRVDARPEAGDLARVEADRPGELFLGQLAVLAVHQHVLERRRDQVRRRLRRAGEPLRVVLLVRVDDAAERVAIGHGGEGFRRQESGFRDSVNVGAIIAGTGPAARIGGGQRAGVFIVAARRRRQMAELAPSCRLAKSSGFSRRRQVSAEGDKLFRGCIGQLIARLSISDESTQRGRSCRHLPRRRTANAERFADRSTVRTHVKFSNFQRTIAAGLRRNLGLDAVSWRRSR